MDTTPETGTRVTFTGVKFYLRPVAPGDHGTVYRNDRVFASGQTLIDVLFDTTRGEKKVPCTQGDLEPV